MCAPTSTAVEGTLSLFTKLGTWNMETRVDIRVGAPHGCGAQCSICNVQCDVYVKRAFVSCRTRREVEQEQQQGGIGITLLRFVSVRSRGTPCRAVCTISIKSEAEKLFTFKTRAWLSSLDTASRARNKLTFCTDCPHCRALELLWRN